MNEDTGFYNLTYNGDLLLENAAFPGAGADHFNFGISNNGFVYVDNVCFMNGLADNCTETEVAVITTGTTGTTGM